jgi:hypothetical protein
MAYIGKTPTVGNFVKLDALTASATASYTMQVDSVNFSPESVNHMLVSLNGVIQSPTTSYTISGSTITFASALTSSDSIDFIMVYGNVLDIGTPSDATVTNAKTNFVSTSSAAGLQIKGDGTTDGTLQLNCSQNSHGIKLKSPAHSSSSSYTLTFPTTDPSADKFLKTDGSGNLSFADAGGGGLVFIKRLVGDSNVSSLDFDNTMSSTYDGYVLQVRQLGTTTDTGNIYVRVVNSSGTVKDNGGYGWSRITMEAGNSTVSSGQGEGASEGYLATDMNNGSGTLMSGTYTIINKSDESTARRFKCFGNIVQYDGTQNRFEQGVIGFEYSTAETIRGFYIYPQSGSLNYVDVALFGMVNS